MSSEDSPRGHGRRVRRVLVVTSGSGSGSSSDSDESVGPVRSRKKRLRVVSEDDSSGSDVRYPGAPRLRLPLLQDSADSDESASDVAPSANAAPALAPASGFASDSSEGNSDKCSICLLRFTDQAVGTPQACEHVFCLDCITEWSKNVNTCPVDRITFESIVVRSCLGGRVIRTEPVKIVERRSSVDVLVVEDPTICEICGSSDSEETMLLCDGCDLGFHMACLTPPLDQIPIEQWFCPDCAGDTQEENFIYLSEVNDLLLDIQDIERPMAARSHPLRQTREVRRSSRGVRTVEQPSTSQQDAADTVRVRGGRGVGGPPVSRAAPSVSRRSAAPRRKYKRRRTKTVVLEYELEGNGKFPTKTIKRRIKKRKYRKRGRTAARRSHVRASVRARLDQLRDGADLAHTIGTLPGVQALAMSRRLAGVPSLSLFGDSNQLEFFSDEETGEAPGSLSVAARAQRPTSAVLSAYRQARRKMISMPSPPRVPPTSRAAPPDLVSSILHSQTLLHSKDSKFSITVDGQVNIKLTKETRLDLSKMEDKTRKAPSYPGQGGKGNSGGWGGGYRGNYHRERGATLNRSGEYDNNFGGNYQSRRTDDGQEGQDGGSYHRDPLAPPLDQDDYERNNRQNYPQRNNLGRHSLGPSWQPYPSSSVPSPSPAAPPHLRARHTFGGYEDPVDMRVPNYYHHQPPPSTLPPPPVFKYAADEDERSDPDSLVIDTEKYDPTEPTNDEEDSTEDNIPSKSNGASICAPIQPLPSPPLSLKNMLNTVASTSIQNILSGIDTNSINVPPNVLDTAVRQVLEEHRSLRIPPPPADDDSDGDCPNFSIYSATSVHIANTSNNLATEQENQKDIMQEGGESLIREPVDSDKIVDKPIEKDKSPVPKQATAEEEMYKERVSKRCPITPATRNPIKIKLNTPSLIKRVSLYDEEDQTEEAELDEMNTTPDETASTAETGKSPKDPDKADDVSLDEMPIDLQPEEEHLNSNKSEDVEQNRKDISEKDENEDEMNNSSDAVTLKQDDNNDNEWDRTPETPANREEETEKDEQDGGAGNDAISDNEVDIHCQTSKKELNRSEEKMTESISETEDERSYTPCLDENKSKEDTSFETEKEAAGIEGLDTEMISEDEGNEMFSDNDKAKSDWSASSIQRPAADHEDGEILDRGRREEQQDLEEGKKKKKKDSKKESKEKRKKKTEVAFKKMSKTSKERNYRDKDDKGRSYRGKDDKGRGYRDRDEKKRRNRDPSETRSEREKERRKEKRKDLERYDVRNLVGGKRRCVSDAFGRDVSPPLSRSRSPASPSPPPRRARSPSASPARPPSALHSAPPPRRSPLKRRRRSSSSPQRRARSRSPKAKPSKKKKRSRSPRAAPPARAARPARPLRDDKDKKRRARKRSKSPRKKSPKRKKIKRRSPSPELELSPWSRDAGDAGWTPPRSPLPPPSPVPPAARSPSPRRKKDKKRRAHRRPRAAPPAPPCKEIFTSGNNILVSVSFDQTDSRQARREARRAAAAVGAVGVGGRRLAAAAASACAKPVAIIDLERSPFRELTPSPKNVIVLSDSEEAPPPAPAPPAPPITAAAAPPPAADPTPAVGPKTPPEPTVKFSLTVKPAPPRGSNPLADAEYPPSSPDAYDPFEPTRSPSPPAAAPASTAAPAPSPAAPHDAAPPSGTMTLEAAQKTNMSADDVLDQRPLTPSEKVMALLQSTRDVSPEAPPGDSDELHAGDTQEPVTCPPSPQAAPPAAPSPAPLTLPTRPSITVTCTQRIVLPSPKGSPLKSQPPKLFLAKPSPIKSTPIKPMQSTKISKLPIPSVKPVVATRKATRRDDVIELDFDDDSPYSPGSSDFGDLFDPPPGGRGRGDVFDSLFGSIKKKKDKSSGKISGRFKKKGKKTQVGVKLDDDNLKILDELPNSAVEMQVKSKFLKKLNRQERVVEEVKLVLKPHYNKKHVTKDEYKDVLRRAVPKICHNKSGEINPTKIQALVEAYVKKIRKKHKLGLA